MQNQCYESKTQITQDHEPGNNTITCLCFRLGNELFALEISKAVEIFNIRTITKVPNTPPYVLGVINLRGNVIPILDTRIKLGFESLDTTDQKCVIIIVVDIEGETLTMGALVDSVEEVIEFQKSNIDQVPSMKKQFNLDYLDGMLKHDESFVMLLNIDKLLSTDELYSFQSSCTQ